MRARFVRWGVTFGMSAVMVVGTAGVGGASVPAKSAKKFCKQAVKVSDDITPSSAQQLDEDQAAELETAFNKLTKAAPTKDIKQATKTMAGYFGEIADGTDPEDISASDYEDFGIAAGKFGLYLTTKCIAAQLPDITLPDLPDITLPDL